MRMITKVATIMLALGSLVNPSWAQGVNREGAHIRYDAVRRTFVDDVGYSYDHLDTMEFNNLLNALAEIQNKNQLENYLRNELKSKRHGRFILTTEQNELFVDALKRKSGDSLLPLAIETEQDEFVYTSQNIWDYARQLGGQAAIYSN